MSKRHSCDYCLNNGCEMCNRPVEVGQASAAGSSTVNLIVRFGGSVMWQCEKCEEYRFNSVKKCCCEAFTVIDEDGEEHTVQTMDEEGAALKYAKESNEDGDYYLMDTTVEITVGDKRFEISAEPDVYYSTEEI